MHMLQAQPANLAEGFFSRRHAAGHYNHLFALASFLIANLVTESNRRRRPIPPALAASVSARHVRHRSGHRPRARRDRTSHTRYATGFSERRVSRAAALAPAAV